MQFWKKPCATRRLVEERRHGTSELTFNPEPARNSCSFSLSCWLGVMKVMVMKVMVKVMVVMKVKVGRCCVCSFSRRVRST